MLLCILFSVNTIMYLLVKFVELIIIDFIKEGVGGAGHRKESRGLFWKSLGLFSKYVRILKQKRYVSEFCSLGYILSCFFYFKGLLKFGIFNFLPFYNLVFNFQNYNFRVLIFNLNNA